MTPEERDRLVRLEERQAAQAEALDRMQGSLDKMADSLQKLATAFGQASNFGKGAFWVVTKIAALILALGAIGDFVLRHWPFKH